MDQCDYVRRLLDVYRATPGTSGVVRRPDRLLAAHLYERGVPLTAVENALVLAAIRRMVRPDGAAPLALIRSLAYFLPVSDEVLATDVSPNYYQHVRNKLQRLTTPQPRLLNTQ
jgi:hypothetical protein